MTLRTNKNRMRRSAGAAMLLVLIAVAMCTILALSFLAAQEPTAVVASNIDRKTQARAIAESALKMAIDYVNEDANWRSDKTSGIWMTDIAMDGGAFTLSGIDEADGDLANDASQLVTLSVVATYQGVTHRVSARVLPGGDAAGTAPGLFTKWFDLNINPSRLSDIDWDAEPTTTTVEEKIHWNSTSSPWMVGFPQDDFAVELTGYLTVPTSGTWTLYLNSDDGSELLFDDAVLIDNDGLHGMQERNGTASLTAGRPYPIRVRFFERGGGAGLIMSWAGPGQSKQVIPPSAFTHDDGSAAEEPTGDMPTLLALYEFEQVTVAPTLAGRWALDEVGGGGGKVSIGGELRLNNGSTIDAYNSTNGVYGGANRQLNARFTTNATGSDDVELNGGARIYGDVLIGAGGNTSHVIELNNGSQITGETDDQDENIDLIQFNAPDGFGGHTGNETYNGGSRTWSSNQHFNQLTFNNDAKVYVSGNVAVRVSNKLTLNNGDIILNPGARLTLWVGHDVTINNGSTINEDTDRAADLMLIMYGNNRNMTINDGRVCGAVHVADDLTINNGSEIYGSVTVGDDLTINDGAIHADLASSPPGITASGVTSAADSSELGNDGTPHGDIVGGVAGQHGTAYHFDGSNDYVEIPHDDSYLMQAGTFSVWFKADTLSGRRGLFSKDALNYGTGGHFSVFLDGSRIEVRMQSTSQSYYVYSPSGSISTGNWYHIMFAWGEEGMALYLNGVLVDTDAYTGGLGTTSGGIGNYEPIVLGANAWVSNSLAATPLQHFFHGTLDDLRIYNERLSESQATEIYEGAIEPSPFLSRAIIRDTSGFGEPLDLAVANVNAVTWNNGAMTFDSNTMATSLAHAVKLHDAIEATGEFSVEVLLSRAAPGTTSSPSRIISYSDGANANHFMLGQDASQYEARVRDSSTGSNGTLSPEFISDTHLNSSGDTHIILSYKDGQVSVFLDGAFDQNQTAGGTINNWETDHYLVFGGAYGGSNFWRGTLKRVAIYDRGFNAIQANNVYHGDDPGTGGGIGGTGRVIWDEQD